MTEQMRLQPGVAMKIASRSRPSRMVAKSTLHLASGFSLEPQGKRFSKSRICSPSRATGRPPNRRYGTTRMRSGSARTISSSVSSNSGGVIPMKDIFGDSGYCSSSKRRRRRANLWREHLRFIEACGDSSGHFSVDNAGAASHEKRLTDSTVSSAASATDDSGGEAEIAGGVGVRRGGREAKFTGAASQWITAQTAVGKQAGYDQRGRKDFLATGEYEAGWSSCDWTSV